jgi:hypothetical protein
LRRVERRLDDTPASQWPYLLAEQQIAPAHVQGLGAAIGLRLTLTDIAQLRDAAAREVRRAGLDVDTPLPELCARAGLLMRASAAKRLARLCVERNRQTRSVERLPAKAAGAADVEGLIVERWRTLPLMRPREVAAELARRVAETPQLPRAA